MKVTNVQLTPITQRNGLIAFASVVIDDSLYLGSIGVHTRLDKTGYRITYPTKKIGKDNLSIYRPTNIETSKLIEEAIISKAKELFNQHLPL